MFTLRRMYGQLSVKCPDGTRIKFTNFRAALEFIRLAKEVIWNV